MSLTVRHVPVYEDFRFVHDQPNLILVYHKKRNLLVLEVRHYHSHVDVLFALTGRKTKRTIPKNYEFDLRSESLVEFVVKCLDDTLCGCGAEVGPVCSSCVADAELALVRIHRELGEL